MLYFDSPINAIGIKGRKLASCILANSRIFKLSEDNSTRGLTQTGSFLNYF
jgi:hypothetical protein